MVWGKSLENEWEMLRFHCSFGFGVNTAIVNGRETSRSPQDHLPLLKKTKT